MEKLVEKKDRMIDYYDIGLNLFCRQFKEPDKIIKEAEENKVCCILTGADMKEFIHTMLMEQVKRILKESVKS